MILNSRSQTDLFLYATLYGRQSDVIIMVMSSKICVLMLVSCGMLSVSLDVST